MPGRSRRITQLQKEIAKALAPLIENAAREAQLLLMHHLGCDELYLLTHPDEEVGDLEALFWSVRRRMENEPLEYITNRVDFYAQEFYIDNKALIPRPETELLVDAVLNTVSCDFSGTVCEVGVGSGIVSIILAKQMPNARFIAVDISKKALEVARKNIDLHNLQERITLRQSDLLGAVNEKIDYLVSNPPYIQKGVFVESNLSYEPQNALYGGEKGDEIIKALLSETLKRKIKYFSCEIGYDQKDTIRDYVAAYDYKKLAFYKDYAGFDRGFTLQL